MSKGKILFIAALARHRSGKKSAIEITTNQLAVGRIFAIRLALEKGVPAVTNLESIFADCDEETILAMINTVDSTKKVG